MMDTGFALSAWDLVLQMARGLLIALLLWGVAQLVEVVPITRARRRLLRRGYPVFAIVVGVLFIASAVQELFGSHGAAMSAVLGLIAVGLAALLWWPLRDLIAGMFLRAGNVVRPGDEIEVSGVCGRVERMGYRALVVLAPQGEVILPYGTMARSAIVRSRATRGTTTHLFRIERATGVAAMDLRRAINEGALQCHWSSITRPPQMRALEDGALEVTVFALDEGFGPAIESAVRAQVALLGDGGDEAGDGAETAPA